MVIVVVLNCYHCLCCLIVCGMIRKRIVILSKQAEKFTFNFKRTTLQGNSSTNVQHRRVLISAVKLGFFSSFWFLFLFLYFPRPHPQFSERLQSVCGADSTALQYRPSTV